MKQLTQSEFETHIRRLINGEISRKKLAKELEMDIHTLNYKIMYLEKSNPQLYEEFIKRFPYKPKEIKIDIEVLALQIIRKGLQQTVLSTGISKMTISRKIRKLKEINPELYELYTARNSKMSEREREEFEIKLEKYDDNKAKLERTEVEERIRKLQKEFDEFELYLSQGLSKDEAARKMGYTDYTQIWKNHKELERILTEQRIRQANKSYRDSMRVEGIKPLPHINMLEKDDDTKKEEQKQPEI